MRNFNDLIDSNVKNYKNYMPKKAPPKKNIEKPTATKPIRKIIKGKKKE